MLDVVTVSMEIQVLDDHVLKPMDVVRAGGYPEARKDFFGGTGAADDVTPLENQYVETSLGEVGRAKQRTDQQYTQ